MRLLITGIIVFLILFYFYLIWPRLSRKRQIRPFLHTMFAHRGYHCIEKGIPENSIPSFRAAISHGYGIELDVHLTSDGKLVVFHDDDLSRICGRPETIESLPLKYNSMGSYVGIIQIRFMGRSFKLPLSLFISSPASFLQ